MLLKIVIFRQDLVCDGGRDEERIEDIHFKPKGIMKTSRVEVVVPEKIGLGY